MKVFGHIFAFYVLFLAFQPGLGEMLSLNKATEMCCPGSSCDPIEEGQTDEQSDKNKDADDNACNPFQSCKCCVVYNKSFALETLSPLVIFSKSKVDIEEKVPPHIALDFWQPPKIM